MRTPLKVTPSCDARGRGRVARDRGDGDLHRGGDRFAVLEPFDAALDAVVLVLLGHVGTGGGLEGFLGVGHVHAAVVVVEVPVLVVVDLGEVEDELAVDVVEVLAVEPDADLVFGGVGGRRAEVADTGVGRNAGHRDLVARGLGAVGERAVDRDDVLGQRAVEEEADGSAVLGRSPAGVVCGRR